MPKVPRWIKLFFAGLLSFVGTVVIMILIPPARTNFVREALLVIQFFLYRALFHASRSYYEWPRVEDPKDAEESSK